MSVMSDLHLGIYIYNDKKDKQTYLEAITGSKENFDTAVDETTLAVTDTKNNTDSTEIVISAVSSAMSKSEKNTDCKEITEISIDDYEEISCDDYDYEELSELTDYADAEEIYNSLMNYDDIPLLPLDYPYEEEIASKKKKKRKTMYIDPEYNHFNRIERESKVYDDSIHEKIEAFCRFISPTPDFAHSCKQIYAHNKKTDKFKMVVYYNQDEKKEKRSFKYVQTTKIRRRLDYYITKNSFIADWRKSEYLFSFDNIVIDVDKHAKDNEPELSTRELNQEIKKLITCLMAKELDFPEFSIVYSGRGVHIWIRLESFSARTMEMKNLYHTFCKGLCNIVKKVITDNSINLEVDEGSSVDPSRVMRLPYTWNTKVNRKATFEKCTERRYTLDELCKKFKIHRKKGKAEKKESVNNNKGVNKWSSFIRSNDGYDNLHHKRVKFLSRLIIEMHSGNCKGRRNNMIFLYYNEAIQVHELNVAREMTEQLNSRFAEPLRQSQINGIYREFEKKAQTDEKFYKFTIETFFEKLNTTFEERFLYANCTCDRDTKRKEAKEAKEKRNQMIQELSEQGFTNQEIAEKVGCSSKTVLRFLNASGNKTDKDLIVELWKQGYKQNVIAKKVGCGESTVSDVLKPFKTDKKAMIVEFWKQGLTYQEIAEKVGCDKSTVSRTLKPYKDNTVTAPVVPVLELDKPVDVPASEKVTTSSTSIKRIPTDEEFAELLKAGFPETFIAYLKGGQTVQKPHLIT